MADHITIIKDEDGVPRRIPTMSLFSQLLADDFRLFGMDIHTIAALRMEYLKRGGQLPPSADSVRATFRQ
jgi:hypothetical protein